MRTRLQFGLLITISAALSGAAEAQTAFARNDFNGDGFSDLAIGMPGHFMNATDQVGGVMVLYGTRRGLPSDGTVRWQVFVQALADVIGESYPGDSFGAALASSDFNDDGYDDLAIGVPGKDVNGIPDAGAVVILYGSPAGLDGRGSQEWTADSPGVAGVAEPDDEFGMVLAATPTRNSLVHHGILAVGVPNEGVGTIRNAGAVVTLPFGFGTGVTSVDSEEWTENSSSWLTVGWRRLLLPVPGVAEEGDGFGSRLAVGDINCDGFSDLVVGTPSEDIGDSVEAGAVTILYGASEQRLSAVNAEYFDQDSQGIGGVVTTRNYFGSAVAIGHFDSYYCFHPIRPDDGYGYGNLVIGIPGHDGVRDNAGAITILRGSATGLSGLYSSFLTQASPSVGVTQWVHDFTEEPYDWFGDELRVGDFNGDGLDDLAIGVPYEDLSEIGYSDFRVDAGAVIVMYGGWYSGLGTRFTSQQWTQDSAGVPGTAETGDVFGRALAVLDLDGDDFDDLVVGVPGEGAQDIGGFNILYGSPTGLAPRSGDPLWTKETPGVPGWARSREAFGSVLVR